MSRIYAKRGKHSRVRGSGKSGTPNRQEVAGSPYYFRPTLGDSDEKQMLRRMSYYGKNSPPEDNRDSGMFVSPRRTIMRV